MVLKGLAIGGAVAAVVVAIFVALTFQPGPAAVTTQPAPAANVMVLPNGMAAPRLEPAQQGAILADGEVSVVGTVREAIDRAELSVTSLRAELSAPSSSTNVDAYAVMSCGGK